MKFHDKNYSKKNIVDLYNRALEKKEQRDGWLESQNFDCVHKYHCQLEAIVEIMEGICVFNIGDGLNNFKQKRSCRSVDERLETFRNFVESK